MSYLTATTDGYLKAEATQQEYIATSMRAYRDAKQEIDDLLAKTYAKLAGTDPVNYWAELTKYNRYQTLSDEISKVYKAAAKHAGKSTQAGLESAMVESYNRQLFLSEWLAPSLKAMPINPYLVKYSITGNIDWWNKITKAAKNKMQDMVFYTPQAGTLTQLLTKNYTAELDRILQTVQNGFITGKSYTAQAKAISDIIGKYMEADDAATGAMYNALRIARTEGQRVLNAGALQAATEAQAQGLDIEKEWLATLDTRTRSSHQSLDGQRRPLDKEFRSPTDGAHGQAPGQMSTAASNIHCRCTTMTIVDGEGPEVRRGRNPATGENEVISFKSYKEWSKENGLV